MRLASLGVIPPATVGALNLNQPVPVFAGRLEVALCYVFVNGHDTRRVAESKPVPRYSGVLSVYSSSSQLCATRGRTIDSEPAGSVTPSVSKKCTSALSGELLNQTSRYLMSLISTG